MFVGIAYRFFNCCALFDDELLLKKDLSSQLLGNHSLWIKLNWVLLALKRAIVDELSIECCFLYPY